MVAAAALTMNRAGQFPRKRAGRNSGWLEKAVAVLIFRLDKKRVLAVKSSLSHSSLRESKEFADNREDVGPVLSSLLKGAFAHR